MEPDESEGRSQQRAVGMYTSRWSLTSLGLRGLLLDQSRDTAYTARTYATKRAIDESAQPYVFSPSGRGSPCRRAHATLRSTANTAK